MTVREGRWDCQYCGTKGILGRHKVCPNCAKSRPEGTTFYLPAEAETVEDEKLKELARLGPDWICEFCSSSNPANLDVCRHCNAPRESVSPQQVVKEFAPGAAPKSGDMTIPDPHEKYRQPKEPAPKKARPRWLLPAIGIILLFACLFAAFSIFSGDELDVSIQRMQWERSVVVEELQTVTEEGWDLPGGARIISQQEEIREYDQVIVGYETKQRQVSERVQVGERTYVCGQRDLGNGFFEDIECTEPVYETQQRTETYEEPLYEQVPVYATKYVYEVERWSPVRTERVTGNDQQAYWPELRLGPNQREGERQESYQIVFGNDGGERFTLTFPLEEWLSFESRGSYKLRVNGMGQAIGVDR
jgi:hypothetical protein